jgi:hypothetical protein
VYNSYIPTEQHIMNLLARFQELANQQYPEDAFGQSQKTHAELTINEQAWEIDVEFSRGQLVELQELFDTEYELTDHEQLVWETLTNMM